MLARAMDGKSIPRPRGHMVDWELKFYNNLNRYRAELRRAVQNNNMEDADDTLTDIFRKIKEEIAEEILEQLVEDFSEFADNIGEPHSIPGDPHDNNERDPNEEDENDPGSVDPDAFPAGAVMAMTGAAAYVAYMYSVEGGLRDMFT